MSEDIRESTLDSLDLIGKLDKISEKLSTHLNQRLKRLNKPRRVRMLQSLSALRYSNGINGIEEVADHHPKEREKLLIELEEISKLRKVVEIIAAKKVEIAIRNYDFIDLNVKTIDAEMALLETAIKTTGDVSQVEQATDSINTDKVTRSKRKLGEAILGEEYQQEVAAMSEPVYCICKRIAFGDMIACDNEDCPVEWFHYPCVNLTRKPKNSWMCSLCSNKKKK
jgi:hypothetical protein